MTLHYKIKNDKGSSGFLCPPGHYNHTYSAWAYESPRHRSEIGISSIDYVLTPEADASEAVRAQVQKIKDEAVLVPSELWIRSVYGYMKTMYVPESGEVKSASDYVSDPTNQLPAERHAAVRVIREYFPDHEPRLDLIHNPGRGYGSYPCTKCGERVQYEARFDALTKVSTRMDGSGMTHWSYEPKCTDGGNHTIEEG